MEQALAYQFSKDELEEGDKEPLMSDKKWSIRDIAWLLTIGFGITFVTTAFSQAVFPESFWKAGRLLLLTTVSICVAPVSYTHLTLPTNRLV